MDAERRGGSMDSEVVISPLRVVQSAKKDFILNLNNYRNTHYRSLNTTKINYKRVMEDQINELPKYDQVEVHYTVFPKSKRRFDIGNVASVHKKYFEDALVEFGKIDDDDYTHIVFNSESFGGVDKENPRVEIKITEVGGIVE